jgi:hypothetical protein
MSAARTSDVVQQGVLHAIEHHFPKTNPMNYDFLRYERRWPTPLGELRAEAMSWRLARPL